MKQYELMLIVTPDFDENETDALVDNIKGIVEGSGNLIHIDVMGRRRLAYPIRKRTEGYYVVYVFESDPSFIQQLNQALRVMEAILRYMIVLFEGDVEALKMAMNEETVAETSGEDTVESNDESDVMNETDEDSTESDENVIVIDENTTEEN